jgi:hypothetical protein
MLTYGMFAELYVKLHCRCWARNWCIPNISTPPKTVKVSPFAGLWAESVLGIGCDERGMTAGGRGERDESLSVQSLEVPPRF